MTISLPADLSQHQHAVAPRKRGRPTLHFDNVRVQEFMLGFTTYKELIECYPQFEHVFTGVSQLQTEGEAHTRPLRRRMIFTGLQAYGVIDGSTFRGDFAKSAAYRYQAAARVVSRMTSRLLDQNPGWEVISINSPLY